MDVAALQLMGGHDLDGSSGYMAVDRCLHLLSDMGWRERAESPGHPVVLQLNGDGPFLIRRDGRSSGATICLQ